MVQKRNAKPIPWELLESFSAISEATSIREAAKALGVNHATLSRQLKKLEQQLGQPLFHRSNKGLTLSSLGENVASYASAMSDHHQQLQFYLDHRGDDISGELTISLGDSLMSTIAPAVQQLIEQHPKLNIAFNVSNDLISLDKGEADIALRITETPPEHLVAIELDSVAVAAFVSPRLLQRKSLAPTTPIDTLVDKVHWISWRQNYAGSYNITKRIVERLGKENIKYTVGNSSAMLEAVNSGLGAAFMMCNFVDGEGLVEIAKSRIELPQKLWLLYHPHTRQSPKVRAAISAIKEMIKH